MKKERLKILSHAEKTDLYSIPQFNAVEQNNYFSLSKKEYKVMCSRGSVASKVHFILQLGYFKATSQFFNCTFDEAKSDTTYILQEYCHNAQLYASNVAKQTRQANQRLVAKLLGYQISKKIISNKIRKLLAEKTRLSSNPVYLFHEILSYCHQHKFMLPNYSTMQDLIGQAITLEEKRLSTLLSKHLSPGHWKVIFNTLKMNDTDYVLTWLKKDPKNFQTKHIKEERKKLYDHEVLYELARDTLPKLKLTPKNIQYYASLAEHYPVSNLKKLSKTKRALYILCFAHYRHQKIYDNLGVSFMHYYQKLNDSAATKSRDRLIKESLAMNHDAENAAMVLRLFDDDTLSDTESFGHIRELAYQHIQKGEFNRVSDHLLGLLFDFQQMKWEELKKLHRKAVLNMRPIFTALAFSGKSNQQGLMQAIEFLKQYFNASQTSKKSLVGNAPTDCIPKRWQKYLMVNEDEKEIVDIVLYELMIYGLIVEHISAGMIFLEHSLSFKSLSSLLISDERWKNKQALLKKLGNQKLLMNPDQLLDDLETELETLIQQVNHRIESGENKHIVIKKNADDIRFTLPYPEADKENHAIFKQMALVNIPAVLRYTQQHCDFMSAFAHIKPYEAKDKLDPIAMMACIIANATNLGIYKMAQSCDLSYQRLYTQSKNFLRLETLKDASDTIINKIANLQIFKYWHIHDDYLFGSVDGQKYETRLHSFIARYSSKYFGVNKGCVAYTLCANHIPISSRVISANHHESHYLFDILFHNSSDIDIDWLSGDGHSINQVNFTPLDFIGKQFAPFFKSINRKANKLCGFKPLKHYNDLVIKPKSRALKKPIKQEWDDVQRIIASLLLGETSQHLIVSKLSSHKRKDKTKDALWAYDNILMSIYLLKFIDDVTIRQNVRRALNRGEAYHNLRRAIASVHGGKFRGKADKEIEVWNECARLMANCMIYYNASILNELLTRLQNQGQEKQIDILKYISPVAWANINLHGYYAFEGNDITPIDITKLAESIDMT